MLPNHDELVRAMAQRTTKDAERSARDRGFRDDVRDHVRATPRPASSSLRSTDEDCRPCPPTASERARGLVG